jgi:uncharacterized oxidoreductase
MPNVPAARLEEIGRALFVAEGVPEDEARLVMDHLIDASLVGHDSHGVIAVPRCIDQIRKKEIVPGAPLKIVQESPATLVVDGQWGFGFVVTESVTKLLIDTARANGVAAATVFQQGHIGRLASYSLMAAQAGMIGLITADSGRGPKSVVPFGGSKPRLGTNPLSIAVPSDLDAPFFLDMATSAVAAGKIGVALARGEQVPKGWLIDRDGNGTTDPSRFRSGDAWLLPLGGSEGHKGYGLAAMVEILCGILTGLGFGVSPTGVHNDGCFLACFDVAAFRPLDTFNHEVAEFAAFLKATEPAEGSDGVLYPGEIEHRTAAQRRSTGIPLAPATWNALVALAQEHGLDGLLA